MSLECGEVYRLSGAMVGYFAYHAGADVAGNVTDIRLTPAWANRA